MKKLYKFEWDVGRAGAVVGVFAASPEDVEEVIGKTVYFGEILGKHSQVHGVLEEIDLTVISENPEFIKEWENSTGGTVGYNPLDYYEKD